jgi:hypothetical protein
MLHTCICGFFKLALQLAPKINKKVVDFGSALDVLILRR